MRKSLTVALSLAALMLAAPVHAQTDSNSGTMKPSATDQDKMTPPAAGAQDTTGAAAPREPVREPAGAAGRAGSGVTGTDSGTKKQDDTDPKPDTQR